MDKVNLIEKFSQFDDQWSPKIVAELNDQYVKIARLEGEFIWHKHEMEDELFMVIKGSLTIKLEDRDIHLDEGELVIVPCGLKHKPVAESEAWVMMFEPKGTLNTGDQRTGQTVDDLERI